MDFKDQYVSISNRKDRAIQLIRDWLSNFGVKDPIPFPSPNDFKVKIPRKDFEELGIWDDITIILKQLKREGIITNYERIWEFESDYPPMIMWIEVFADFKNLPLSKIIKASEVSKPSEGKRLITRDGQGSFFYNGKSINFNDSDNIYFKIFKILFDESGIDGFLSYANINRHLQSMDEKILIDQAKIVSRISNGLKSLWRFTNLKNQTPDGNELIQRKKGKGLIFYNPETK